MSGMMALCEIRAMIRRERRGSLVYGLLHHRSRVALSDTRIDSLCSALCRKRSLISRCPILGVSTHWPQHVRLRVRDSPVCLISSAGIAFSQWRASSCGTPPLVITGSRIEDIVSLGQRPSGNFKGCSYLGQYRISHLPHARLGRRLLRTTGQVRT